jgi:uncharacterized protein
MQLPIAKSGENYFNLLTQMANRHGVIAGATGTGKTVTLQSIAEKLSDSGVPVFLADVKGDLTGIAKAGGGNTKVEERLKELGESSSYQSYPVTFWDVFGQKGHPVRATVSDMGPLLLGRLLNLSEVQEGVLSAIFQIADDQGLLLLDLDDLSTALTYVGQNAKDFRLKYGNITSTTIGAIQRGIVSLKQQGGESLFGEPALNIFDFMQLSGGRGMINIMASDTLMERPKTYATFLLWLLSELYENMPEVGELEKPKLVFFFDEAHLLFDEAPSILLEKVEQVVRLIRSKGVGVFFVTQNPIDIPDKVLAQMGNRVQHALRAYTPRDQKAIKAMSETFRENASFSVEEAITDLKVGEALISFLDEKGAPSVVQRAFVLPPKSQIGTLSESELSNFIKSSFYYGRYEKIVNRESAHEILMKRFEDEKELSDKVLAEKSKSKEPTNQALKVGGDLVEAMAKSAVRSVGYSLGRQILRGVLGSMLGGKK